MEKEKVKKPIHKRWWFWVVAVLVVGSWIVGNDDKEQAEPTAKEAAADAKVEKKESAEKEKQRAKEEEKVKKEKEEAEKKQKEKEAKEKEDTLESAKEQWEKEDRDWWIEEHSEQGVVNIYPTADDFRSVVVVMANEFKLLDDNQKQYLVDEVGKAANNFIGIKFGHNKDGISSDLDVVVEFDYADGTELARQRVIKGGWKLK